MLGYVVLSVFCCLLVEGAVVPEESQRGLRRRDAPWNFNTLFERSERRVATRDDPPPNFGLCDSNPCQNNGICVALGLNNYFCTCVIPLFTGKNCEYLRCFQIPWPAQLSGLPQPFFKECSNADEVCALSRELAQCVCRDSYNCAT